MKRSLWMSSLLLIVSATAAGAREDWREQSEKVVDAQGLTGVVAENARGYVEVRPSKDGRVHLTALKLVRCHNEEKARTMAGQTQVVTTVENGRFVVRVRYPQRQQVRIGFWDMFSGYEWPRVEVRLALEIPPQLTVRLKSSSGDLITEDLTGAQDLETTSGDITSDGGRSQVEARSTSGGISVSGLGVAELRTVSGDIEVSDVRGALRANTTSGEIVIQGAADSIVVGSVSGDVRVTQAPRGLVARTVSGEIGVKSAAGGVSLESTSGDVSVGLDPGVHRADVTTASGDIVVGLAPSVGCILEMSTSNGTLDASVPIQVKSVSRRLMSGVIRRGGAPVTLKTSSGDINVKSEGD